MSCAPAGTRRPGALHEAERDMERGLLTARGLDRVLRVAWTVADLAGARPPGRRRTSRWPCNCAPGSRAGRVPAAADDARPGRRDWP